MTRCSRESDTSSIISEMSNSELSDPDAQHCIFEEEFPEIFEPELRSKDIKHTITTTVETASEVPIASKVRRLSAEKFRALQDEIKRLTSQGILVPSHSPWSFPIVMVKKKTPGAFRLCADFTALNKILKARKYPLPNVLDFASLASGSKFFSSLDCSDAYYSIPVAEEHQHKLCITTPLGSFQYPRLPMGLASSASWYQLLMNQVLKNISNCICYLDDILLFAKTKAEHDQLLRKVLSRLSEHSLTLNRSKCVFAASSLNFLGHQVSEDGFAPLPNKVEAIKEFELPRTPKQLRRFLGMYQYYAKFVKAYAEFLQPLYNFITKSPSNRPLNWSEELKLAFSKAKAALSASTMLAYPDPSAATELITDASGTAVACVLQQVKNGVSRPLLFWSKSLNPAQRLWSAFDRELLAIYASLRHVRYLVAASEITIKTDHKPLIQKFYSNIRFLTPRQERQFNFISQFTNKLEHISGKLNFVADALSRPATLAQVHALVPPSSGINYKDLVMVQSRDPDISQLRRDNTTSLILDEVLLDETADPLVCDISTSRRRPIVPDILRYHIFSHYHGLAHPGVRISIKLVSRVFVWPSMRRDITRWVSEYHACQRNKIQRHTTAPLQKVSPPPKGRFTHVYVDLTGPMEESYGYFYLLVVICNNILSTELNTHSVNKILLVQIHQRTCSFLGHGANANITWVVDYFNFMMTISIWT